MTLTDLPNRLRAELERLSASAPRLELFTPDVLVLVAVSGGRDSVALLHLAQALGLKLSVAHLDHGLRKSSVLDAAFVRDLARGMGVPFHTERTDVLAVARKRGLGLEEAARTVRYAFLTRTARQSGASAILTAHTMNDNAETLLMQLLRGTARATGIPPRRDRILRPLLTTKRSELEAYLQAHRFDWREDETNQDVRINRNWLRHEIIPMLETHFPGAAQTLARYAQLSRDEDAFLEEITDHVPAWSSWRTEAVPVQRRLIRRLLEAARIRTDFEHIESLREALSHASITRLSLPDDHTGLVLHGRAYLMDRLHEFRSPAPPEASIRALEMPAEHDFSAFASAKLRFFQPGDRIRLAGGTRKLSDVLADRRVPREWRARVPVVAQGSQVLWVGLEPSITDVRLGAGHDHESDAMTEALRLAHEAFNAGEVPIGAVVVRGTEVVGRGRNRSVHLKDMTRHAELEAIRDATQQLGTPYLTDCTLVVTLEPCPMCLGAALESRIGRIVFGAVNHKAGALGGLPGSLRAPWLSLHRLEVRSGLRVNECSALLTAFFEGVRERHDTLPDSQASDSEADSQASDSEPFHRAASSQGDQTNE